MGASRVIFAPVAGPLFGAGLALSTMTRPEVVLAFLRFEDFGLLLVLAGATSVTLGIHSANRPALACRLGANSQRGA
jgi:hypothetical protein